MHAWPRPPRLRECEKPQPSWQQSEGQSSSERASGSPAGRSHGTFPLQGPVPGGAEHGAGAPWRRRHCPAGLPGAHGVGVGAGLTPCSGGGQGAQRPLGLPCPPTLGRPALGGEPGLARGSWRPRSLSPAGGHGWQCGQCSPAPRTLEPEPSTLLPMPAPSLPSAQLWAGHSPSRDSVSLAAQRGSNRSWAGGLKCQRGCGVVRIGPSSGVTATQAVAQAGTAPRGPGLGSAGLWSSPASPSPARACCVRAESTSTAPAAWRRRPPHPQPQVAAGGRSPASAYPGQGSSQSPRDASRTVPRPRWGTTSAPSGALQEAG